MLFVVGASYPSWITTQDQDLLRPPQPSILAFTQKISRRIAGEVLELSEYDLRFTISRNIQWMWPMHCPDGKVTIVVDHGNEGMGGPT